MPRTSDFVMRQPARVILMQLSRNLTRRGVPFLKREQSSLPRLHTAQLVLTALHSWTVTLTMALWQRVMVAHGRFSLLRRCVPCRFAGAAVDLATSLNSAQARPASALLVCALICCVHLPRAPQAAKAVGEEKVAASAKAVAVVFDPALEVVETHFTSTTLILL